VSAALVWSTIAELGPRLERRELSSEELTRAAIARTEALEPKLNSYVRFLPEQALAQARQADAAIARKEYRGPLHGVPISLKDLFDVEGIPTSGGARFLRDSAPRPDAAVTRRLKQAGAVLLGKSNLNKFAGGESGDNPDFGKMRNPWSLEHSPGGSSGGSAAQVAAGLAWLSVGTDNGGSVRIPAALCGIVGLKPTHGLISMEGMFPRAYTFDHPGPLTRSVEDCALALQVLAGHDRGDSTTRARPIPDYRGALAASVKGLRIGVDREFMRLGQPQVRGAVDAALKVLVGLGARLVEVTIPKAEEMNALFGPLFIPEWGAAHEPWLKSHPEEYPEEWAPRAALLIPAVEYIKAARQRRLVQVAYARATRDVDVLASPTYPIDRRPFAEYPLVDGKKITIDDAFRYTMPFDLLGLPAVSVPCGFSDEGFPIGLQLAGKAFDEATVLRAAHAYERATEWHKRRPPI
jgi:aspartyl-tRNA(Asn)/glutamyl-tRNA(Gln) amidotransferase subunit A